MPVGRMGKITRRRTDAKEIKLENRVFKTKERLRRDSRMMATISSDRLPYSPQVMSWLSRKLDKPSTKITPEDVKTLLN